MAKRKGELFEISSYPVVMPGNLNKQNCLGSLRLARLRLMKAPRLARHSRRHTGQLSHRGWRGTSRKKERTTPKMPQFVGGMHGRWGHLERARGCSTEVVTCQQMYTVISAIFFNLNQFLSKFVVLIYFLLTTKIRMYL